MKRPWFLTPGERVIIEQLEALMAKADDVRAAQEQTSTLITAVQAAIDAVQAEVQALIDRLNTQSGIPDDILVTANAINERLIAMRADVESTPPAPADTP
jgi:small-conductance mechanosensitive channel